MEQFNCCLISLFIIAYFSISILWLWLSAPVELRPANTFSSMLMAKLEPIVSIGGWEQNWALFSPNVRTENSYSLLVIAMQNRLLKLVELPRMEKLNLFDKLTYEKYRKLFNDNLINQSDAFLRPDIAKFLSQANNEPGNKAVRTTFFLISHPIAPPDPHNTAIVIQSSHHHAAIEKYFVYGVSHDHP